MKGLIIMDEIAYKYISDTFNIPNMENLLDIMLFNNGMRVITIDDTTAVRACYGIRVRYLNKCGKRKSATGYGSVTFLGGDIPSDCSSLTVSLGSDTDIDVCRNLVKIFARVSLLSDAPVPPVQQPRTR